MVKLEIKKVFKRRRSNKKRYSANKIYVSRPELKHINSKLHIIIYIYNKQKSLYENHIRKIIKLHIIEKYLIRNEKKRTLININRIVSLLNSRFYLFTKWNIAYYKKSDNLLENRKQKLPDL